MMRERSSEKFSLEAISSSETQVGKMGADNRKSWKKRLRLPRRKRLRKVRTTLLVGASAEWGLFKGKQPG